MDVFLTHVYDALEAHHGTSGGGSDAVLSSASFGDDAFFAETLRQEDLAHGVVDFVCAGVCEVFSFEPDLCAAELPAEVGGVIKRSWSTYVVGEKVREFFPKGFVFSCGAVGGFKFTEGGHEGFGDELATIFAETSAFIGDIALDWWSEGHGNSREMWLVIVFLQVYCGS